MLPVSAIHFLVTLAYLIIGLAGLKLIAIKLHDKPSGQALGVLTF